MKVLLKSVPELMGEGSYFVSNGNLVSKCGAIIYYAKELYIAGKEIEVDKTGNLYRYEEEGMSFAHVAIKKEIPEKYEINFLTVSELMNKGFKFDFEGTLCRMDEIALKQTIIRPNRLHRCGNTVQANIVGDQFEFSDTENTYHHSVKYIKEIATITKLA